MIPVYAAFLHSLLLCLLQVMETKNMIYIVSEYASQGEIFGECTRMWRGRETCSSHGRRDVRLMFVRFGALTACTMKMTVI
jgi:hypothetical protein